jgi:hypothetical protein
MLMDTRSLVICSHGGRGGDFAGGSQSLQIERPDIFDRRSASSAIDSPDLTHWNRGATGGAYADRPASPAPSSASSESHTALVSRWNGVEAGQEPIHASQALVNRWNRGGSSHGHERQRYSYRGTPGTPGSTSVGQHPALAVPDVDQRNLVLATVEQDLSRTMERMRESLARGTYPAGASAAPRSAPLVTGGVEHFGTDGPMRACTADLQSDFVQVLVAQCASHDSCVVSQGTAPQLVNIRPWLCQMLTNGILF